jgi:hypothetical protein
VHPIAWVPSAFVPLAAALGRGALARRIKLGVASAMGIGLVVAATAAPTMLIVYRAQQSWGNHFASLVQGRLVGLALPVLVAVSVIAATLALRRTHRFRRAASFALRLELRLGALGATIAVARTLDDLSFISPWLGRGYWALYLAPLVAGVAATLAMADRRPWAVRAMGAGVLAVGIAFSALHRRALSVLPTDALEAAWAIGWRDSVPDLTRVAYLERAGKHVFMLPIYEPTERRKLRVFMVGSNADGSNADGSNADGSPDGHVVDDLTGSFYYRSSTCSTAEGRAFCASLESQLDLEPVALASFPALPSLRSVPYDAPDVSVGLYRVRGGAPSRRRGP